MIESRRRLLTMVAGAAGVLAAEPMLAGLQSTYRRPLQPKPSSDTPDRHNPVELNGPNSAANSSKSAIDQQTQKEIRAEIARLYELVAELKEQVEKTDGTTTLSVSVVKKAQEIEKLAKQIKDRAKG
jgi:hypothetical protein